MGASILEHVASGEPDVRLLHARPVLCRVVELLNATPQIWIVRLEVVEGGPFRFLAGQYARVTFGEQRPREYSMANCADDQVLEFHVRHASSGGASAYVARQLRVGERVWVEGPFGHAWLRPEHRGPILAIAGGSGLAPVKSIVETAVRRRFAGDIRLYVGARNEADLYLEEYFGKIAAAHPPLKVVSALSEPVGPTSRRIGTVVDAVAADITDCAGMTAYVAGPSAMVEAAVDLLLARGLRPEDLHSDLCDATAIALRVAGRETHGEGEAT